MATGKIKSTRKGKAAKATAPRVGGAARMGLPTWPLGEVQQTRETSRRMEQQPDNAIKSANPWTDDRRLIFDLVCFDHETDELIKQIEIEREAVKHLLPQFTGAGDTLELTLEELQQLKVDPRPREVWCLQVSSAY